MKKVLLCLAIIALVTPAMMAQEQPYKVVFDLTSADTSHHLKVLRWMKLITESNPQAELELVVYGAALPLFIEARSVAGSQVELLATNRNVRFRACALTMKRYGVDASGLIKGVAAVPDAIHEIVKLQALGWGYIKVTN